jgi:PAS domain S-box-containing protein
MIHANNESNNIDIIESIGDGVIIADGDAKIIQLNKPALLMLEIEHKEAFIGKKINEVFIVIEKDTGINYSSHIKDVLTTKTKQGLRKNSILISQKKNEVYISASVSPMLDQQDQPRGIVVVFRDITRIIKAEQQLANERKNFKSIFDSAPNGMIVVNQALKIINFNHAFADFIKCKPHKYIGESICELFRCFIENKRRTKNHETCENCLFVSTVKSVLKTESSVTGVEQKVILNNDTTYYEYWVLVSAAPILLDVGHCVMVSFEDITRKKILELEMEKMNDQLLKSKLEAEAANKAKSEFLSNMSHEIRTPLNGIIGLTKLTLTSELTLDQKENLEIINSCADMLLRVINDILDYSKLESKKMTLERRPFDLKEMLEDALKVHKTKVQEKGIDLVLEIERGVPLEILGDSGRLVQILNNLIGNSIKFTEKGFVKVMVHLVDESDEGVMIRFAVVDSGIGISNDDMGKLFQSFSQVDGSISRKYGGTGLGLAISKELITEMGGEIWVESQPNKGSTFYFTIFSNTAEQAVKKLGPQKKVQERLHFKYQILIVEDDKINQIVLSRMLKNLSQETTIANNGFEAIEMYQKGDFDMILMDIHMPLMDGIEATRRIKQEMKRPIPIIAVSALAMAKDREDFLSKGMDGFVPKPIIESELIGEMNRVNSQYQQIENTGTVQISSLNMVMEVSYDLMKEVERLESAVDQKNKSQIEEICNEMKTYAQKIENIPLKNVIFKIQLAARKEEFTKMDELLSHLHEGG